MSTTKVFKVYGLDGHRQRESFYPSYAYNWGKENSTNIVACLNSDFSSTNDYSILVIERNTLQEVYEALDAHLYSGILENSKKGKIEEVTDVSELREIFNCLLEWLLRAGENILAPNRAWAEMKEKKALRGNKQQRDLMTEEIEEEEAERALEECKNRR